MPSTFDLVSWPLFLTSCVLVSVAAHLFTRWLTSLPERVPLHWGLAGEPDSWGPPRALWVFAGLMLVNIVVGLGVAAAFARERWALPERASERALELYPTDMSALGNGACLQAKLGHADRAIALLERVSAQGWGQRDWLERDPDYDSLRDDPRFQRLLTTFK